MSSHSPHSWYLTTTLPYVNGKPHMGHALEFVQADAVARYLRLIGDDVFFNTGTDEHGLKIYRMATQAGVPVEEYVARNAKNFSDFQRELNTSVDNFIRTTDAHHKDAAREFWRRCREAGDIYRKAYRVKYCVGCELEKTDSELEKGECPIHPGQKIEIIEEDNYFFRFSKYAPRLLELYETQPDFVLPSSRMHEIQSFVGRGLEDFSISRLKEKMPWGVGVPDDPAQVMYVWFDALVNYISAIGWPEDRERFARLWPVVQFAGKDNLRQQSAMWQAMLFSAGLSPSKKIVIHGFVTSGGQKMSKSVGNVVDPREMIESYGTDALRYYLLREIQMFEDGDFTRERFAECYHAHLVNGIGNLTARVMKLAEQYLSSVPDVSPNTLSQEYQDAFAGYDVQKAADIAWGRIGALDRFIQEKQPWKVVKDDADAGREVIKTMVVELSAIADMLVPLIPETAEKIKTAIRKNIMPEPLFPRKEFAKG